MKDKKVVVDSDLNMIHGRHGAELQVNLRIFTDGSSNFHKAHEFHTAVEELAEKFFGGVSQTGPAALQGSKAHLDQALLDVCREVLPAYVEPRIVTTVVDPGYVDIHVNTVPKRAQAIDTPRGLWSQEAVRLGMNIMFHNNVSAILAQVTDAVAGMREALMKAAQPLLEALETPAEADKRKYGWLSAVHANPVGTLLPLPEDFERAQEELCDFIERRLPAKVNVVGHMNLNGYELRGCFGEWRWSQVAAVVGEPSSKDQLCKHHGRPVGLDGVADFTMTLPLELVRAGSSPKTREACERQLEQHRVKLEAEATARLKRVVRSWPTCHSGEVKLKWLAVSDAWDHASERWTGLKFIATWFCTC